MKPLCLAAAVIVSLTGCASTSPPGNRETVWPGTAGTNAYALHAPEAAPPQQRLSVGTSFPDTELILPWFLNDIIDFVNYR